MLTRPAPLPTAGPTTPSRTGSVVPGVALCLAAAGVSLLVHQVPPGLSPLLVAVLLGVATAHLVRLPAAVAPGVAVSSRRLLRVGIVLLGLQLSLGDILGLGWRLIVVVVAVVGVGLAGTVVIGRRLGLTYSQSVLVGAGFSICGAAAVAGVEGSIGREDEEVATAVGLVVVFGTAVMLLGPLLLSASGLPQDVQGQIVGASTHEVAQVVAAGGLIGGTALATAIVVKLARVLMLAPVVMVVALLERRRGGARPGPTAPPLVPLFVAGFLAAALARTFLPVPEVALAGAQVAQTVLLAAAMFALGLGVHVGVFRRSGVRPLVLGLLSTLLVAGVATTGVLLASG